MRSITILTVDIGSIVTLTGIDVFHAKCHQVPVTVIIRLLGNPVYPIIDRRTVRKFINRFRVHVRLFYLVYGRDGELGGFLFPKNGSWAKSEESL